MDVSCSLSRRIPEEFLKRGVSWYRVKCELTTQVINLDNLQKVRCKCETFISCTCGHPSDADMARLGKASHSMTMALYGPLRHGPARLAQHGHLQVAQENQTEEPAVQAVTDLAAHYLTDFTEQHKRLLLVDEVLFAMEHWCLLRDGIRFRCRPITILCGTGIGRAAVKRRNAGPAASQVYCPMAACMNGHNYIGHNHRP